MHILFIHQNFPAQFGHVAAYLAQRKGFRCSFVSEQPAGNAGGIKRIQYRLRGGATEQTHYCSRSFENAIWHSHAVYEALEQRPELKPDLVVAHSGFLSTVFLRELYDCPIVNYFEYYYRTRGADMDFRPDFPYPALNRLRANGLLADFFDAEGLADLADRVLDASQEYKHLGRAGVEMVRQRYSLEVCLPRMLALYEDAFEARRKG